MAAKMERTRHPGIFKRGSKYVVTYRVNGRPRKEAVRTLEEARRLKAARETDRNRGEFEAEARVSFRDYADGWIARYRGNGRRGFTEETRSEYRRDLARYAFPFFSDRLDRTVSQITPGDVDRWIAWLCDEDAQGRHLADATVRRIVCPVRACLASARREELIRRNPVDGAVLPNREPEVAGVEEGDDAIRVFTREQLDAVLRVVHPDYRSMFRLLAGTGLRWGEVSALRRGDLALGGSRPVVKVRRSVTKTGRFKPPKSSYGIRDVPLSPALVSELRAHLATLRPDGPEAVAFPSKAGTPLRDYNVRRRYLRPAAEEAGAAWAGFHTFRHTFASLHIAGGTNIVQVSRLLGHHSPAFTLKRYAHLIPGDEAEALDVDAELAQGGNGVATDPTATGWIRPEREPAKVAS